MSDLRKNPPILFKVLLMLAAIVLAACGPNSPGPAPTSTAAARPASSPVPSSATLPPGATLAPAPSEGGGTAFDAGRAFEHVQYLASQIGKRVAGSAGGQRATEYLKSQFESLGYQVSEQRFPFTAFEEMQTTLAVVTPASQAISASALIYSPSGHVRAELVAIPFPNRPENYAGIDVKGKIALVQRGQIFLRDKARAAAQAGAAAVIIYNTEPQAFVGTLQEPAAIPTLAISGQDGQTLVDLLKQGPVTVQLDSQTDIGTREGVNVIATRAGSGPDSFVFGAHYDSVTNSIGADDNGSGTAVLLELARVLAGTNRSETLVFVGFDGEEEGLLGSAAYVAQLGADQRSKIKAMFNYDELGATDNPLVFDGSQPLVQKALAAANRLGITARSFNIGGGSDYASFLRVGVPALMFYRDDPLFHTPQDTPDRVRPQWLEQAGRVTLELLANSN